MARIILSSRLSQQIALLQAIKLKHESLGAASPLTAFLNLQGIVLAHDLQMLEAALQRHDDALALGRQSELAIQLRNLKWKPVKTMQHSCSQFLKLHFKPNFAEVGLWGSSITTRGKITYPKGFLQRAQTVETLVAKHNSYSPAPSPLTPFLTLHNIDMAAIAGQIAIAKGHHNDGAAKARLAEEATRDRNNKWGPVKKHLRAMGQFLIKLYTTNSKELGDWGFTVDDSPRAPKMRNGKVLPSAQITINIVAIGGTFTNTGTVPLHVYKKFGITMPFQIIPPAGTLVMTKGYGAITIVNPSTLEKGKFSVLVHR